MQRTLLVLSSLLFLSTFLAAQTRVGLVAEYHFDGNYGDFTGNSANTGVPSGLPEFACGVDGSALRLDGGNDLVRIPGGNSNNVNREFDTEDFTVAFYFKPIGQNGIQYLVSKRDTACGLEQYFYIRYSPATRTVSAYLREGNQVVNINAPLRNEQCWQHLGLVRENRRVLLYVNGLLAGNQGTTSRVNIANTGDLLIGSSNCLTTNETAFVGLIEDFRVYNRALAQEEVDGVFQRPDQILTPDTRIFLGESVDIVVNSSCGVAYNWSPAAGVMSPDEQNPTIMPVMAGPQTFRVRITDAESSCVAVDSIRFQVIDPATLACDAVYLPRAFTPNGDGPAVNETFGISNPYAVPELISLEIFSRWGGRVFSTADAFGRWDGTFEGEMVNPGTFLWRVRFMCEGEERFDSGSVTLIR
ncbi:MAG: LamG-like jellyroll fold domain-containing protein [Saprospiraceae bacterium]